MKLTKRIGISLAILALVVTPLLANCNQIQTVVAAKSSKKTAKGKITLIYGAHLYNKHGHKIKNKKKYLPYAQDDASGYKYIYSFNADVMKYYGTKIIKGQKFYNIGKGCYINAADVKEVNGKNSKKGKLVLLQKSAVYTKAGNKRGHTLPKRAIVKYQGKVKQVKSRPKYYYSKYFK
ncbi:SLAP domain-containing protein, partial [uncultured Lactobacillus sp.]|uniref:SLAP domain-containing protein n=1 Tax=uncultured Lactobacillus sp. TaxID=153152 RepID=UPI003458A1A1